MVLMSSPAGTPPVNTILTQALPGSPTMKIQVVSSKSGFDFEVKLSYDPTVSWKKNPRAKMAAGGILCHLFCDAVGSGATFF